MPTCLIENLFAGRPDPKTRTFRNALIVPFGQQGNTNLGRFQVTHGSFTLPKDLDDTPITLWGSHPTPDDLGRDIVGRVRSLREAGDGIRGDISIANNAAGRALLAELAGPPSATKRSRLSVEVRNVAIRAGKAVGGIIFGVAAVPRGAFPSASLMAQDVGDLPEEVAPVAEEIETDSDIAAAAAAILELADGIEQAAEADETENDETEKEDPPVTLNATAARRAPVPGAAPARPARKPSTLLANFASLKAVDAAMARNFAGGQNATLLAALDQAILADLQSSQQPQWLGELYADVEPAMYGDLVSTGELTAMKATAWRFTPGKTPTVGDYEGFPTQPASTEVKTELVEATAARLAGAGAVDRAWVDFEVPGFWAGYLRESVQDYERKKNVRILNALLEETTPVTVSAAAIPTAVNKASVFILDGVLAVMKAERGMPKWALVGADLYRQWALTRTEDSLAYLDAMLGFESGHLAESGFTVRPCFDTRLTGKVLVSKPSAVKFFELPGSPVRVDTVNIANGGIEKGVFGYTANITIDAASVALVSAASAG